LHVHAGSSRLSAVISSAAFWWHASQKWVVPLYARDTYDTQDTHKTHDTHGEAPEAINRHGRKRSCVPAEPDSDRTAKPTFVLTMHEGSVSNKN
jgi:hypothetical protein